MARWFLGCELPVGCKMTGYRDKGSRQESTYTYTYDTHLPPLYQKIEKMNRKMWKLKDVKIEVAEISLINSVLVRIKFSRVLTLSKTRPSSDV